MCGECGSLVREPERRHEERNPHDICVFNRTNELGVQCTAIVHVDDLLITSVDECMIERLSEGLRRRYGEITETNGTILNYLEMVLDFSHPDETRVSMKGFVEDMLLSEGLRLRYRISTVITL
jgi:hypothetical protein